MFSGFAVRSTSDLAHRAGAVRAILGAAGLVVPVFSLACALSLQPACCHSRTRGFDRCRSRLMARRDFPRTLARIAVVSFDVHCWFS